MSSICLSSSTPNGLCLRKAVKAKRQISGMAFDGVCPVIARQKFDSVCQTERGPRSSMDIANRDVRITTNSGHSSDALEFAA